MDEEILGFFKEESLELVERMTEILEEVEENLEENQKLEEYGQLVDRIMGAAKSLGIQEGDEDFKHISSYSELCKLIGYKAAQLKENSEFCNIVVAFLLDATDMLEKYISSVGEKKDMNELHSSVFLERLRFIADKFDKNLHGSVAIDKKTTGSTQEQIDELLKKMGVG